MNTNQYRSHPSSIPRYTWLGLAILVAGETGIALHLPWVATWFTPIMWTGFILTADGVLARLRGRSWLTTRRAEFPFLALISVLIWLVFEVYNFRLQNWLYRGLPADSLVRDLGYFWSFATIAPAILISSELIHTLRQKYRSASELPSSALPLGPGWPWILIGFTMVAIPPLLPIPIARFTFGFVWIGFILLFDPINERLRAPSLRHDLTSRPSGTLLALMLGGLVCGLLWEAWNFQALGAGGGHWVYKVPEQLRIFGWHYGQMPILGMLGFPPFAVEIYVLYQTVRSVLDVDRLLGRWTL
ncbi:MAG: hypothetical protein P8X64_06680 [Anaerolineales bacterium]|jgi:hypothetical protein